MITGYFIRSDGDRCALIRQDEHYREETVIDALPFDRAAKLYWRYMREWLRDRAKRERMPEPTLFPVRVDARPPSQRTAAGRYEQPSLFEE